MYILLPLIFAVLAGCTHSSGVLKLGPDTYTTSAAAAPAAGGSSEARRIALTEANQYCAKMGKEILVKNIGAASGTSTEITFRCLSKGDPELQRPEIRQAPEVTVEDRQK
jgi:hypothetical protein